MRTTLLNLLQDNLLAWKEVGKKGKRPNAVSVERQVQKILTRQHMRTLKVGRHPWGMAARLFLRFWMGWGRPV